MVNFRLAVRRISIYKHIRELTLFLTYNYKTFTSGRINRNKRKISRVDIPTYYSGD